jgi:hypothetical protein
VSQPGELEYVGMPAGYTDYPAAMSADQEGQVVLDGSDAQVADGEVVVVFLQAHRPGVEQGSQRHDAALQASDAGSGIPKRNTDGFVLGPGVAGTDPQHSPTGGHAVHGGHGSGQQGWVVEFVVDDQGADPKATGGFGRHYQGDEGVFRAEVVVGVQLLVAQILGLASRRPDGLGIGQLGRLDGESEGPGHFLLVDGPPDMQIPRRCNEGTMNTPGWSAAVE